MKRIIKGAAKKGLSEDVTFKQRHLGSEPGSVGGGSFGGQSLMNWWKKGGTRPLGRGRSYGTRRTSKESNFIPSTVKVFRETYVGDGLI